MVCGTMEDAPAVILEVLGVGRGRTVRERIHAGLLQRVHHIAQSQGSFGGLLEGRMGFLRGVYWSFGVINVGPLGGLIQG